MEIIFIYFCYELESLISAEDFPGGFMLGKRLLELRKEKNLSVAQVAESIGVSPSTYREWEYGRAILGEPYMKLAELFDVSIHYLLTGEKSFVDEALREVEELVRIIRLKA